MKEHPILFSAPMVRAILAGTKTQTRRVMKPQPPVGVSSVYLPFAHEPNNWQGYSDRDGLMHWYGRCPYGQPGDRLWVRETHSPQSDCWGSWDRWMRGEGGPGPVIHYKASDERAWVDCWRPSIHMPRWASRITLEITGVRVERLHEAFANDADCIAEGIEERPCNVPDTRLWRNYTPDNGWTPSVATPGNSFRSLWESINGPSSWDANPWVWVVEFRRVTA